MLCEIVIYRKAEVAFAAAQVVNANFLVLWELFVNVLYMLKKSVYLSELALLFVVNSAALGADTQLNEEGLVA